MTHLAERRRIASPGLDEEAAKRIVDLVLALALVVVLAPLLALLCALVRLDLTRPGAVPAGARREEHAPVHHAETAHHVRRQ